MTLDGPRAAEDLRPKPGVLFAAVDGEGVLMDLAENRYVALSATSAALWQAFVAGAESPTLPSSRRAADPTLDASRWERQLALWQRSGLVVPAATAADLRARLPAAEVGGGIARREFTPVAAPERISAGALWRALRAWWWSRRALSRRGLPWALQRLAALPVAAAAELSTADARRAAREIAAARVFRWLFAQGAEDCLPRSLALVRTLRRGGIDARLCFGVRKFPFAAHAWAEAGGCLLNETTAALDGYVLLGRFGSQ